MERDFHIALIYQEPIINSDLINGFEEDIHSPGLKVLVEPVPMMRFRAALEWLVPTAIVAYIAKPYFESFLSEMGKDHYAITKKALGSLGARIQKKFGERLRVIPSKGKLGSDARKFSPVFSIEAQTPFDYRVKLLFQTEMQVEQFNLAVEAFLSLLAEIYSAKELTKQSKQLLSNNPMGSILLVCFNPELGQLEYVNPIPENKRS
jgi:hypothetical protein